MDIERLTKSQIVLLTLLVSFVTSIATGIVSVTLMQKAPPSVTQTINRVVEHTVERVVPTETQVATVVTQEKTVTVKESDLIASAVARVRPSLVRIVSVTGDGEVGPFLTRGIAVSDYYVVSDASGIKKNGSYAIISGETTTALTLVAVSDESNLALFSVLSDKKLTPAAIGTDALGLGASVIAFTGTTALKVVDGIVSVADDSGNGFESNIDERTLVSGSVFTNMDGAFIGMFTGDSSHITPASAALTLVKAQQKESGMASTTTP